MAELSWSKPKIAAGAIRAVAVTFGAPLVLMGATIFAAKSAAGSLISRQSPHKDAVLMLVAAVAYQTKTKD